MQQIWPGRFFISKRTKLVDTMITADMINIAINENELSIISSDDDFWPGIMTALHIGAKVFHILTKTRITANPYSSIITVNYNQKNNFMNIQDLKASYYCIC